MDNQSSTKGLVSTAPHTKTLEMKENKEAKKEPENTLNQLMAFQGALDEKKKKMKKAKKETENNGNEGKAESTRKGKHAVSKEGKGNSKEDN